MQRIYTACRRCKAPGCFSWFTMSGSAQKFCKSAHCVKRRRKADRAALKVARAPTVPEGSEGHLERALKSTD